jgi:RNA polymerase subunit RPABC4/transcription elongation factor Spt4|tara:strand:- start:964 stop:1212 length:249 start_codon:yes stop_codon:yes gene_type:complete
MANCQHCNEPNPEGMFNCPCCGQRANPPRWSTQFVVRENNRFATAIRKDQIDIRTMSHKEGMEKLKEGASKVSRKGQSRRII